MTEIQGNYIGHSYGQFFEHGSRMYTFILYGLPMLLMKPVTFLTVLFDS